MNNLVAIAAGGALGAVCRYGMARWVQQITGLAFPAGTLTVNAIGSFVMGFATVWMLERSALGPGARLFLLTGVLGAFTTFSAFSVETLSLVEARLTGQAALYVAVSVVMCLAMAWLGMMLGRQV